MIHWLHQFSDLLILLMVVGALTAANMLAPHIGRRLFGFSEDRDNAAFDAFNAVISIVGIVLAFSLVEANTNLRDIDGRVAKEAAALQATDRVLLRFGKPEFVALRPLLATYGESIVKDEWPKLSIGQRNQGTDDAYTALSIAARKLGPDDIRQQSMYNELLKQLDDLADLREEIISSSDSNQFGLPKFYWFTIEAFLCVCFVLAMLMKNSLGRTVGIGAASAAIGLAAGLRDYRRSAIRR